MVGYIRTTKRTVIEGEVSKNEIELMIRRNKYVQLPNDWELRDEMFDSLCNKTIIGSDDWIDSENWGSDSSENMFGELENYEDHILEILGFRRELVGYGDDYPHRDVIENTIPGFLGIHGSVSSVGRASEA